MIILCANVLFVYEVVCNNLGSRWRITWSRTSHLLSFRFRYLLKFSFVSCILLPYSGIGDPKYHAVPSWESLNKTLEEALESYNDINAIMNLVLFGDAMNHMWGFCNCLIIVLLLTPIVKLSLSMCLYMYKCFTWNNGTRAWSWDSHTVGGIAEYCMVYWDPLSSTIIVYNMSLPCYNRFMVLCWENWRLQPNISNRHLVWGFALSVATTASCLGSRSATRFYVMWL